MRTRKGLVWNCKGMEDSDGDSEEEEDKEEEEEEEGTRIEL